VEQVPFNAGKKAADFKVIADLIGYLHLGTVCKLSGYQVHKLL